MGRTKITVRVDDEALRKIEFDARKRGVKRSEIMREKLEGDTKKEVYIVDDVVRTEVYDLLVDAIARMQLVNKYSIPTMANFNQSVKHLNSLKAGALGKNVALINHHLKESNDAYSVVKQNQKDIAELRKDVTKLCQLLNI